MSPKKAKELINNILNLSREANEISKTASRHKISLGGNNFYGNKFHQIVLNISSSEAGLKTFLSKSINSVDYKKFEGFIKKIKSSSTSKKERNIIQKQIELLCQATIIPNIQEANINHTPRTEQVLPFAVVRGTKGYFENMITQANGCYEHGWYESCSVMIRKFVENLIIEVFEENGVANEIKDTSNNFFMLEKLINSLLAKNSWNLQRDTKKFLPQIKALGDRAAHNRRYLCTKADIDKVLSGLRVISDDLLHLANLK